MTKKVSGADYQQERLIITGWVVGFTDGEGCFSVSIVRNQTSSIGWQVMPEYVVTQGESSLDSLTRLRKFFNCGNIFINNRYDNHKENLYRYCVRSLKDLNSTIVPFFRKNPLQTAKNNEFIKFADIMDLIYRKEHLTIEGIKEIAKIASKMNLKKSRNLSISPETTRRSP